MTVKTFKAQYELLEFDHYIDHSHEEPVSVVCLILRTDDIDYIKDELNDLFAVEDNRNAYIFSDYEIAECYELKKGIVKVVCIK